MSIQSIDNARATSRRWCWTLFNYTTLDEAYFQALDCKYTVVGKEVCPTTKRAHLQGFTIFNGNKRLSALKKLNKQVHWEPTIKSSLVAADYCKKEGDFFEKGDIPSPGKRTDLEEVVTMIKAGKSIHEIADEATSSFIKFGRGIRDVTLILQKPYSHTDQRGLWFVGPPGSGKSREARDLYPECFLKGQNKWFDGYQNEKVILLDDFDHMGKCLGHHLKIWADRYACTGETKGGTINLQHTKFIITSNYYPHEIWSDDAELIKAMERRFTVRQFGKKPTSYADGFHPTSSPVPSPKKSEFPAKP